MKKIILLLSILLSVFFVQAQTWDGSASTNWNDPQNWTPATVPLATGNVTINSAPYVPALPATTTVNNFSMNVGSSINFNGFSLITNGNIDIDGATLTNSNGATDITVTTNGTGSQYIRNSIFNDHFILNHAGTGTLYEAYQGGNTYNANVTFNHTSGAASHICYQNKSTFNGNLTVNRTVAGSTEIFEDGFTQVSGNFSYTNNAGGISYINGSGIASGTIGGTVNFTLSGGGNFSLRGIKNLTGGGSISVQDPTLAYVKNDTLLLNTFNITGITASATDDFDQNQINATVNIADAGTNTGPFYFRNTVVNGNTTFTVNADFFEAYQGGNTFNGNSTFNFVSANPVHICYQNKSAFNGNVTVSRTVAGSTEIFEGGFITLAGNFSYTNNAGGISYINGSGIASGPVGGTVNILLSGGGNFSLRGIKNLTGGGSISVQDPTLAYVKNDTLLLNTFNITGITASGTDDFDQNQINATVNIADAGTNTGSFYFRNSVINGNTTFTINAAFYEAYQGGNTFNGNSTFNFISANQVHICYQNKSAFNGNVTVSRTVAGSTEIFEGGFITLAGNFSYTNNAGGISYINGSGIASGPVGGTLNILLSGGGNFSLRGIKNNTPGGSISVQDPTLAYVYNDTLLLNTFSITGITGGPTDDFNQNHITGAVNVSTAAGNTGSTYFRGNLFENDFTFTNNGSANVYESYTQTNEYLGNASFVQNQPSNILYIAYGAPTLFHRNLTVNSSNNIFSVDSLKFVGNTNTVFDQLGTQVFVFTKSVINKTGGATVTLNDRVLASGHMRFQDGYFVTTQAAPICFTDGATHAGAGNASHVNGVVQKIGNDAFTFPVGDGTTLKTVSMTAPDVVTDRFSVQYFNDNPSLAGYDTSAHAGTLLRVSGYEYWDLRRDLGTSNESFTFSYTDPGNNQYITNPANARIAHWTGSTWADNGNTASTGTTSGTVTAAISNFTQTFFTFGSTNLTDNPLLDVIIYTYYADTDNDNFGDLNNTTTSTSQTAPAGYVADNTDCNDADNTIYPGAPELCDNKDNDCDGTIDDGVVPPTFYRDFDNDGFGDAANTQQACTVPVGYVSNDDDCDDTDNTVYPNAPELCDGKDNDCDGTTDEGVGSPFYRDFDNDGFGDANNSQVACSAPVGYVANDDDCDDTDNTVYPNAPELCDGKDNDCDGTIDDGAGTTPYYADADGDGFGDPNVSVTGCTIPPGYVSNDDDCDDTNNAVFPGAPELCDGKDNNCDGNIDEGVQTVFFADADGDGFGNINDTLHRCSAPAGYVLDNSDCDDNDNTVYPGAPELCDAKDNDCDGSVDEGVQTVFYADDDGDGYGNLNDTLHRCVAPAGYVLDNTDCDDTEGSVNPGATEIVDGIDNDCDGLIDEGVLFTFYLDSDNDGFGDINNSVSAATAPPGYVPDNTDCDDTDNTVYPGAPEICDGKDNDCDGTIDVAVSTPIVIGPTNMCPYEGTGQQVVFTIDLLPGVTGYQWTVPSTINIVSGQNTNTLTVTIQAGFATNANKQIRVTTTSICGTSPIGIHYLLAQFPSTPGFITGPVEACSFVGTTNEAVYKINKVVGATSYIWTVSAGMTINSHPGGNGVNDTIINVLYAPTFTGGTITVRAANNCGTSVNVRQLSIVNGITATPGLIQGPANACLYMPSTAIPAGVPATYTIRKVLNATSYTWSVPAGATATHPEGAGVNDTVIVVTYSNTFAGGNITVSANGSCASSSVRSLVIQVNLKPGTIAAISANETQSCPNRQVTYSIVLPSSTSWIEWTVPAGAAILSGQGTASIIVSYPSASNGSVTATSSNGCGIGKTRSLQVSTLACRPVTNFAKGTVIQPALQPVPFDVQVYPNPAQSEFNVAITGRSNEKIKIRIYDVNGKQYLPEITGPNTTSHFGNNLKPGIYMVEVIQGDNKKVTRVIKL